MLKNRRRFLLGLLISLFTLPAFAQPIIKIDSSFNKIGYNARNVYSPVQGGSQIMVNPADQKYIVRGSASELGAYLKYNRDGSFDNSFNGSGALLQPNSEIYAPGFFIDNNGNLVNPKGKTTSVRELGFMRTLPTGVPDSSFGTNGVTYVDNSQSGGGLLMPLVNGKFLLVTPFYYGNNNDTVGVILQQFKSYYALDSSFGVNGTYIHKLGYYDMYLRQVKVFNDGKILITGTSRSSVPGVNYDYDAFLMRCLPSGALDGTFGKNGQLRPYARESMDEELWGSYILPDGKFVVCGYEDSQGYISKFNNDGSVDNSFGVFGRIFFPELKFFNILQQRDGKFIAAGNMGYKIARITEDGARDNNFGTNGVYKSPAPLDLGFPWGCLLENDSMYLLTGNAFESNQGANFTTARYKIRFQPFVTGVKSRYCIGDAGTGTIINLPQSADTTVTVLYDNATVLPVNGAGQFNFTTGAGGNHTIEVKFVKGSNVWNEVVRFTTSSGMQSVSITTSPQLICDGSAFTVSANVPCFWGGDAPSVKAPSSTVAFNPTGRTGPQQIIAFKDNGGCNVTMDTVVLEVVKISPVITENAGVLSTPVHAAATYKWYVNNVLIPGATSTQFTPLKNGYYTVVESMVNCSKPSAPYTISSFPLPVPQIINVEKDYCSSTAAKKAKLLNPQPAPGTVSVALAGFGGLTYDPLDSSFAVPVNSTGNQTITVTYAFETQSQRKDTSYLVKQTPSSGAAPTQSGNKLTIPVTGTAYQWYRNGSIVAGATAREYTITQAGSYAYTYTVDKCTSALSAALNAAITAVVDPVTNLPVFISPNPAKEHLYISGLNEQYSYQVLIVDLMGKQVKKIIISRQNQAGLYIGGLLKGMYFIHLKNITRKAEMGVEKIEIL